MARCQARGDGSEGGERLSPATANAVETRSRARPQPRHLLLWNRHGAAFASESGWGLGILLNTVFQAASANQLACRLPSLIPLELCGNLREGG